MVSQKTSSRSPMRQFPFSRAHEPPHCRERVEIYTKANYQRFYAPNSRLQRSRAETRLAFSNCSWPFEWASYLIDCENSRCGLSAANDVQPKVTRLLFLDETLHLTILVLSASRTRVQLKIKGPIAVNSYWRTGNISSIAIKRKPSKSMYRAELNYRQRTGSCNRVSISLFSQTIKCPSISWNLIGIDPLQRIEISSFLLCLVLINSRIFGHK